MIKSRLVLLLVLIILLLTGIAGAARANQASPKEMLMERIKKSPLNYFDISRGAEGAFEMVIKDMKGWEGSGVPAESLEGSGLKVDGSLNTLQQKLQVDIAGAYDKQQYQGSFYIDGDRFIFTRDFLEAARSVDPSLFMDLNPDSVNQYVYSTIPEAGEIWADLKLSDPQKLLPVYRDMLLFLLEAVPDKYFTYSGGKIVFSLDREGLEEVIYAIMLKVVLEQDRFNDLVVDYVMATSPSQNREELKKEVGGSIEGLLGPGDKSPVDLGEIKEALSIIDLEKFVVEISPDPAGEVSFDLEAGVSDQDFSTRLDVDLNMTGSRATELKSAYSIVLTMGDGADFIEGSYTGDYSQKGGKIKEEDTIVLNIKIQGEEASATALVNVDMKENSSARVDIPVLTGANSTDIAKLTGAVKPPAGAAPVSVFLDGKPVKFDVPPYMSDGRVMVPVRNLAEALGCQVEWVEPNRVVMTREGLEVVMLLGQRVYTVNGKSKQMDVPPLMIDGRNIVPLRFVAQELGCRVEYDGTGNRVYVYSSTEWMFTGQNDFI